MLLNTLKFDVFAFTNIEIPFTGRENAFCVLDYSLSQSNKTVQHAFVMEFSKQLPTALQIWTWHQKFMGKGCLCKRKGSGRSKTSEWTVDRVRKRILQSPNKSYRRKSLETKIPPTRVRRILKMRLMMKPTTRSGHNGVGQAKAQAELTSTESQAESILNMCEIGYEIHISLNFYSTI